MIVFEPHLRLSSSLTVRLNGTLKTQSEFRLLISSEVYYSNSRRSLWEKRLFDLANISNWTQPSPHKFADWTLQINKFNKLNELGFTFNMTSILAAIQAIIKGWL